MGLLSRQCLDEMGFASVGARVRISDKASFYGCGNISIGDDVRIDDFCVLSAGPGGICIGKNVHVAVFSSLIGAERIVLEDFSNISSRVSIYSNTDDFSGECMTNPTIPERFVNVRKAAVVVGRHVVIGAGTVILPGVTLGEGVAVGALSLVKDDLEDFGVYAGVPVRYIRPRSRKVLEVEKEFMAQRAVW